MAIWNRITGIFFGGAVGAAASKAIEPALEPAKQEAWLHNRVRVLDVGTAAQLAAKGIADVQSLDDEAARQGFGSERLLALVELSQSYPGTADLRQLHNRALVPDSLVDLALSRHGIPGDYHTPLKELFRELLSAAEVAAAVQQGHLPNDGILPDVAAAVVPAQGSVAPVAPDQQPPSHVPLTQVDLDPHAEAAGSGVDAQRLQVLANLAGLPPGAETVLAMWNRGLIDEPTVDAGIREGHLKTKWAGAFKRMRWAVLSAPEFAEARLRDWITQEQMYEGGALTGHTTDQMDLMFKNRGRTATPRQIWLAWARKVVGPNYPGDENRTTPADYQDHEEAIRRSNIRPEYARMLWGIRYNYPPLFQLNRLVQAGVIDGDTAALWASYNLEAPDVIDALKTYWAKGSAQSSGTSPETKAQNQLWTAIHRSYIDGEIDVPRTDNELATLVADEAERAAVLQLWEQEKGVTIKGLTPSQIKKAYSSGELTLDAATVRLELLNWTQADAYTFLTS